MALRTLSAVVLSASLLSTGVAQSILGPGVKGASEVLPGVRGVEAAPAVSWCRIAPGGPGSPEGSPSDTRDAPRRSIVLASLIVVHEGRRPCSDGVLLLFRVANPGATPRSLASVKASLPQRPLAWLDAASGEEVTTIPARASRLLALLVRGRTSAAGDGSDEVRVTDGRRFLIVPVRP